MRASACCSRAVCRRSEIQLQGARIDTLVGQLVTAGMSEHMRMHAEWHLGGLAEPFQHAAEANRTHRCSALAHEHVAPRLLLTRQAPQSTQFDAGEGVYAGYTVLRPRDLQPAVNEVDLLPAQTAQLGRPPLNQEGRNDEYDSSQESGHAGKQHGIDCDSDHSRSPVRKSQSVNRRPIGTPIGIQKGPPGPTL
jgi:hypothetical protein